MKSIIVISFLAAVVSLSVFSCKKDSSNIPVFRPDSLIFRRYNPISDLGERSKYYILKNNGLYLRYAPFSIPAHTTFHVTEQKLPDCEYQMAQYLISNFPYYLLQHDTDVIIGCPGCMNLQVIELKGFWGGTVKEWNINTDTTKLPIEIRQYINHAGVIIDHL